jgi:hypothetical protein
VTTAPSPDKVLSDLLALLEAYLPQHVSPLPAPSISITNLTERPLAIGNWRGVTNRRQLAEAALKGGRLDAEVCIQLWASNPGETDTIANELHKRFFAARNELWKAGLLRLIAKDSSVPERTRMGGIFSGRAWRKTSDYKVLYEFHYEETEGAESILVRIPIHSDFEHYNSVIRETTVVTDEIARWDDEGALTLEVSGSSATFARVAGLTILAYLISGWSGNQVTLARLRRGLTEDPTTYPDLTDFHEAVTRKTDPDRHAQVKFDSIAEFLEAFSLVGDPIALGDWDQDGARDLYQPGSLGFDPPIVLESGDDLMRLSYQNAAFDAKAVVYLRVGIQKF